MEAKPCNTCGKDLNKTHPELAHLLEKCPPCSKKKVKILTYSGKHKPKH